MKQRNINLDLIRCVAVIFVLSVHFYLKLGFYDTSCVGKRMWVLCLLRTLFITCVPLFLMLTGYLMNKKELSFSYYKGIKKTYSIYVLISIACLIFRTLYLHEEIGKRRMILEILDFTADNYAWYIEMYIGLFLLIPFLNILWNNLDGKKRKWVLLTLITLSTLPSFFNCWNFLPADNGGYNTIFPDYWEGLYPFTYYFLGAYLSSKENSKKTWRLKSIIILVLMISFGSFTYIRSYSGNYEELSYNNYQGIQVVIMAFLIFKILLALPLQKIPNIIKQGISKVSELSLGIYLASSISDKIVYPHLQEAIPNLVYKFEFLPVAVGCTFLLSLIISLVADIIYKGVNGIITIFCVRSKQKS